MKSTQINKTLIATALAGSIAALPMSASATNGILAYGNGMIAHGVGGAGVANAAEPMSATDNPALAARTGAGWQIQASAFNPNRSANVGRGYIDSDNDWFLIPGGAWFTEMSNGATAGITVSALGGMNTDYPMQLMGAPVGMDLSGVIVAPTIAANVTDNVSLGGALLYGYQILETTGPGQPPLPMNTDDSASGIGFEFGVAIDLGERTTVGLDYQSKIDMDVMEKHAQYIFAHASDKQMTLPPITTLGIAHQLNDKWKVVADISSVPWSDIAVINELFGWEDQTVYKIGAETQVSDDLAIRFGYNYGESPIPDEKVQHNILAPATTEQHFSIGFTKAMGAGKISGYYARVPNNEQMQAGGPGGFPSIQMDQNAFGIGYHVDF